MPGYVEYLRSTSTADLVGIALFALVILPGTIFSLATENGTFVIPSASATRRFSGCP